MLPQQGFMGRARKEKGLARYSCPARNLASHQEWNAEAPGLLALLPLALTPREYLYPEALQHREREDRRGTCRGFSLQPPGHAQQSGPCNL